MEEETCALVAVATIVQAPQQTKHLGMTLFNLVVSIHLGTMIILAIVTTADMELAWVSVST